MRDEAFWNGARDTHRNAVRILEDRKMTKASNQRASEKNRSVFQRGDHVHETHMSQGALALALALSLSLSLSLSKGQNGSFAEVMSKDLRRVSV